MMALTHGLVGLGILAAAAPLFPGTVSTPLFAAAFIGGFAPDADIVFAHRKSFHYPVGFVLVTFALAAWYLATPVPAILFGTVAVATAAVHAWMDILAGSVEPEPWNPTTDRAVYNHAVGRWHRPRRLIPYSGAPEDFLVAGAAGAIAVAAPVTNQAIAVMVSVLVIAAGIYTVTRRRLSRILSRLFDATPDVVAQAIPEVVVEETESGASQVVLRRR